MSAELGGEVSIAVPGNVGTVVPASTSEEEWRWAVEGLGEVADCTQQKSIKAGLEPLNRFTMYLLNREIQAILFAVEPDTALNSTLLPEK
ncbi:hypothetical protein F66182_7815 [Fusarium sp. NRRL 66182]|nr:hypothetical protein F66182_7815 [Fusarium sp. NRRL 66182]